MPTVYEIRAQQLENAVADEHFWHGFAEMQTERGAGSDRLTDSAQQAAAEAKAQAETRARGPRRQRTGSSG